MTPALEIVNTKKEERIEVVATKRGDIDLAQWGDCEWGGFHWGDGKIDFTDGPIEIVNNKDADAT
jgi:hypothetical protein